MLKSPPQPAAAFPSSPSVNKIKTTRSRWSVPERMYAAFSALLNTVMNSMMNHVPFDVIINKMGSTYGQNEFGEFRPMLLDMMSTYHYEVAILQTAKKIWDKDLFRTVVDLQSVRAHGVHPRSNKCGACSTHVGDFGAEKSDTLYLFLCGHTFHARCIGSSTVCLLCQHEGAAKTRSRSESRVVSTIDDMVEDSSVDSKQQKSVANSRTTASKATTNKYVKRLQRQMEQESKRSKSAYDILREIQGQNAHPEAEANPFENTVSEEYVPPPPPVKEEKSKFYFNPFD
jgi:hypothetical protein